MIAAFLELDHGRAAEAPLPALFLGDFDELLRCRVLGTVTGRMHLVIANTADSGPTSFTPSYLAPVLHGDVVGFDPFTASSGRAVNPVFGSILLELSIPCLFELLIKKFVDMLKRNMFRGTTLWRHMSRISHRHGKDSS